MCGFGLFEESLRTAYERGASFIILQRAQGRVQHSNICFMIVECTIRFCIYKYFPLLFPCGIWSLFSVNLCIILYLNKDKQ